MRRGLLRSDGGGATPLDERDVGPSAASRCRSRVRDFVLGEPDGPLPAGQTGLSSGCLERAGAFAPGAYLKDSPFESGRRSAVWEGFRDVRAYGTREENMTDGYRDVARAAAGLPDTAPDDLLRDSL